MNDPLRNEYDVVGRPTPKKDGTLKALGCAEYADDIRRLGAEWQASAVRSA